MYFAEKCLQITFVLIQVNNEILGKLKLQTKFMGCTYFYTQLCYFGPLFV